jgi:hypothetical protein
MEGRLEPSTPEVRRIEPVRRASLIISGSRGSVGLFRE